MEAAAILAAAERAVVGRHYGLDGPPNFEYRHWHLHVAEPLAEVALRHYGLDGPPNFEGGAWHLRVAAALEKVAADTGLSAGEAAPPSPVVAVRPVDAVERCCRALR